MKKQAGLKLSSIFLTFSMLFFITFCQNSLQTTKMLRVKFQQYIPNGDQGQNASTQMMPIQTFMKKIQEKPQDLFGMKEILITNWPGSNSKKQNSSPQTEQVENRQILANGPTTRLQTAKTVTGSSSVLSAIRTAKTETIPSEQMSVNEILASLGFGGTQNGEPKPKQISSGGKTAFSPAPAVSVPPPATNIARTVTSTQSTAKLTPPTIQSPPSASRAPTSSLPSSASASTSSSSVSNANNNFPSGEPPLTAGITALREYVRYLTNNLRAKNGAGKVVVSSLMNKIAQEHSNDMVVRGYFEHMNPDGEKAYDRAKRNGYVGMIGENLAIAPTLDRAQKGFEESPTHFSNAINPQWQEMGVGIARDEKSGAFYVTVLFIPRDLKKTQLTTLELADYASSLISVIKSQNPSIQRSDPKLSSIIGDWLQSDRSIQLMQYVVNKGGYRTPMTAATYTVDYSNDFVERVRKNNYFVLANAMFSRVGLGLKQKDMKLEIYCVFM